MGKEYLIYLICSMTMDNWLNEDLKKRVRNTFEPRYKRPLTDMEVAVIAENLTSLVEHFLKFKRRLTYGTQQ
jgi:hypothetical protein